MNDEAGSFGRNALFDVIVRAAQDSPALDRTARALQPFVARLLGDTRERKSALANFLHGFWVGHPLHPVLTDVPIGAWTMAALFDTVAALGDDRFDAAADLSVGIGLAAATITAASGFADWSQTSGRPTRLGLVHATCNVAATAFYTASAVARGRNRSVGRMLAYAGYALAGVGAGLGGHLVFGAQIGVNHAAFDDMSTEYQRVADSSEVAAESAKRVTVAGRDVMLVRRQGRVLALLNACAHFGGPLCDGVFDEQSVRCPWHGSRFRLSDGLLLDGPATMNQPAFDVREREGAIELRARSQSAP